MPKRVKTPFDVVTGHLGQLSRDDLVELRTMVDVLLSQSGRLVDLFDPELEQVREVEQTPAAPKGHIEAKRINGYGPYLYLRYWQGKTLKSKYIGKGKEADEAGASS